MSYIVQDPDREPEAKTFLYEGNKVYELLPDGRKIEVPQTIFEEGKKKNLEEDLLEDDEIDDIETGFPKIGSEYFRDIICWSKVDHNRINEQLKRKRI